jgi:hypothetical protein
MSSDDGNQVSDDRPDQWLDVGAGIEMAAAGDVRVAVESAVFGMPEVKLGIPSVIEAALLPMLIGWGRTRLEVSAAWRRSSPRTICRRRQSARPGMTGGLEFTAR